MHELQTHYTMNPLKNKEENTMNTMNLCDNLDLMERKLNGAGTLLDTIFMEFIDGYDKTQTIQRILASHERFVTLMEMLADYTGDARQVLPECQRIAAELHDPAL